MHRNHCHFGSSPSRGFFLAVAAFVASTLVACAKADEQPAPVVKRDAAASGGGAGGTGNNPAMDAGRPRTDAAILPFPDMNLGPQDPAPWTPKDIGSPEMPGSLTVTNLIFTAKAGGSGIGGTSDAFFFASQTLRGDGEILVRVRSLQATEPDCTAGLMLRAPGAEPGAANLFLGVLGDTKVGGIFQYRATAGGATKTVIIDPETRVNQFLRIQRRGRVFTAYRTANRTLWLKLGTVEMDLPAEISVGLAATSKSPTKVTTAEFDFLRAHNVDPPSPWIFEEMNAIGGGAFLTGNSLAISSFGDTFNLTSDTGSVFARGDSGNRTITAKITSLMGGGATARVGVIIRDGIAPANISRQAPYAMATFAAGSVQFHSRKTPGTSVMAVAGMMKADIKLPLWLRLEKTDEAATAGSLVKASYSADGVTWTALDSSNFGFQEPFLVGFFADAASLTRLMQAAISDISVTGGTSAPADAGAVVDASDTRPPDTRPPDTRD